MWKKWLILCLLLSCHVYTASAQTLCTDGRTNCAIILEETSGEESVTLRYAAEELRKWLGKISGADIPVRQTPGPEPVRIRLGTPASSGAIDAALDAATRTRLQGTDGFVIRTAGNDIYLAALCPKGVLNAVYRFLDRNTDIVFVRPLKAEDGFGTIYGRRETLTNGITDLVDIPVFFLRQFRDASPAYEARNLCSSQARFWKDEDAKTGAEWYSNTAWIRGSAEGQSHPEWFAERNGKRQPGWWSQLCFTSPDALSFYRKRVEEAFLAHPAKVRYFSVNHSDNWNVCTCARCLAPIVLHDGTSIGPDHPAFRSAQFFRFYDTIMKDLERNHPDRQLSVFAYLWSAEPPPFAISPRIQVDFAPYVKQHKKPIYDPSNKPWGDRIERWMKQHGNLTIYEYYFCTSSAVFPNPAADVAALDLRYYAQSGSVRGMKQDLPINDSETEPAYDRGRNDFTTSAVFDMSAIELWTVSRLYWDPSQDPQQLRDEFCRRAYREAAAPMREFYRLIGEQWHRLDQIRCDWISLPRAAVIHYIRGPGIENRLAALLDDALQKVRHPGSRELIQRQKKVFDKMLEITKDYRKNEPRSFDVPFRRSVPMDSMDFDAGVWTEALVLDDFRVGGKRRSSVRVKLLHDRENLYIAFFTQETEKDLELARSAKIEDAAKWPPSGTWGRISLDGDLGERGGFYHFVFNPTVTKYAQAGRTRTEIPGWELKREIVKNGWKALMKIPLSSIGRNISQNNVFSAMFYSRHANESWLGGDVEKLESFHHLVLQMD